MAAPAGAVGPVSAAGLMALRQLGSPPPARAGRVLLYDGVCNLCNSSLRFIAKRDPNKNVMFCSLQSRAALPYLQAIGLTRQDALQRLLFIEYKDWSEGSTAALRVAGYMRPPYPLLKGLLLVPEPIRDGLYNVVAQNRYRLFGRSTTCQVPPPNMLDRFVDRDELLAGTCVNEAMEDESGGRKPT